MRVVLHGINFSPELTGIGKYSGELADWLARRGQEVQVVTAPPYYPDWKVHAGFEASRYVTSNLAASTRITRCPIWIPRRLTGLTRLLHLASFALSSLPVMLKQVFWRPDVVIVVAPALFCAPAAWLTARLCGAKVWLHVQDFEVDAAFDLGILKSAALKKLVLFAESLLLRRFDRVSTISPRMVERLVTKGVAQDRAVLFPNWVDTGQVRPLEQASTFRDELGIPPNTCVVLYAGNMGEKQGLETLLKAAASLAHEAGIQFVLCGAGAARDRLYERYASLANIRWLPVQPLDRLNDLLNLADIHALPQRADVADLVMPSKLTGMLASGRPVVAGAAPGTQVAEVVGHCGTVVPPDDAEAFAAAIRSLAADPTRRREMGERARSIALEECGQEAILTRFEAELARLVGNGP